MNNIAVIIPARGGSKGITNKNLTLIKNKPLIDYTIEFAKLLELEIFVTSDDKNILERSNIHGVNNILSPKKLATDKSRIIDTLLHASEYINSKKASFNSLLILQPTFLIRDLDDIKNGIKLFENSDFESVVALTKMREHPCECIQLNQLTNDWKYLVQGPKGATNRQEFKDDFYFISGNFYLATINSLFKYKSYMHDKTGFFVSEDRYIVDIDYPQDLEFAETQIYRQKF